MTNTIVYAPDFVIEMLDYSPDDTIVPGSEADMRLQPTGDSMQKEQYCVMVWNGDKHSFIDVKELICTILGRSLVDSRVMTNAIDDIGREVVDMDTHVQHLLEVAHRIANIELGVTAYSVLTPHIGLRQHQISGLLLRPAIALDDRRICPLALWFIHCDAWYTLCMPSL